MQEAQVVKSVFLGLDQHRCSHVLPELTASLQLQVLQTSFMQAQVFWTITAGLAAFGSQLLKEIWEYTNDTASSIKDALQSTTLLHQYFLNV